MSSIKISEKSSQLETCQQKLIRGGERRRKICTRHTCVPGIIRIVRAAVYAPPAVQNFLAARNKNSAKPSGSECMHSTSEYVLQYLVYVVQVAPQPPRSSCCCSRIISSLQLTACSQSFGTPSPGSIPVKKTPDTFPLFGLRKS